MFLFAIRVTKHMHAKSNSDLEAILLNIDLLELEEGEDPRDLIFRLEHLVRACMNVVKLTDSWFHLDDIYELTDLNTIVHYEHAMISMKHLFFYTKLLQQFEIDNYSYDIHDMIIVIVNVMLSAARVLRGMFEERNISVKEDAARALCAVRDAWYKLY